MGNAAYKTPCGCEKNIPVIVRGSDESQHGNRKKMKCYNCGGTWTRVVVGDD